MTTTRVLLSFPWIKDGPNDKMMKTDLKGLSDAVVKVAKKELREDKNIREQSLLQLRDWLKKNFDVENVRTDDSFLLRFLRTKKYSVPMAQQQLLKYLNMRRVLKHLCTNLDFLEPGVNDLINNGYIFASPIRDKNGRRVILGIAKNFNPHKNTYSDMTRAHFLTYETLMDNEENQVLGFTHVGDFGGMSAAFVSCWNPTDFLKVLKWGEASLPMRHKEIYLVNIPGVVKYVIDGGKSMLSNKIRDRLQTLVTIDDLKKKMDVDCLPKEMGGQIPMADMVEMWKMEIASKRDMLIGLDKMKILSDRGIISKSKGDRTNNANINTGSEFREVSVAGSFRKLEID